MQRRLQTSDTPISLKIVKERRPTAHRALSQSSLQVIVQLGTVREEWEARDEKSIAAFIAEFEDRWISLIVSSAITAVRDDQIQARNERFTQPILSSHLLSIFSTGSESSLKFLSDPVLAPSPPFQKNNQRAARGQESSLSWAANPDIYRPIIPVPDSVADLRSKMSPSPSFNLQTESIKISRPKEDPGMEVRDHRVSSTNELSVKNNRKLVVVMDRNSLSVSRDSIKLERPKSLLMTTPLQSPGIAPRGLLETLGENSLTLKEFLLSGLCDVRSTARFDESGVSSISFANSRISLGSSMNEKNTESAPEQPSNRLCPSHRKNSSLKDLFIFTLRPRSTTKKTSFSGRSDPRKNSRYSLKPESHSAPSSPSILPRTILKAPRTADVYIEAELFETIMQNPSMYIFAKPIYVEPEYSTMPPSKRVSFSENPVDIVVEMRNRDDANRSNSPNLVSKVSHLIKNMFSINE